MLEQDPADVMVDALIFIINNTANGTHTPYSRGSFSPPSFAVSVNCLFFASLSASIVAALASVVSLQWVAEYDAAVSRSGSSPEDRVKRRQFRYEGMEKWKMKEIIAALPIFLYCSLVLFFAGLAQWMWNVHTTVGGVVLGGALLGGTFYLVTTLLTVAFPSSPFRAPIVRWIYLFLHSLFHSFVLMKPSSDDNTRPSGEESSKPPPFQIFTGHLIQVWNTVTSIRTYHDLITYISSIFTHKTIQARDQVHIEIGRKSLASDSLAWLAENISISSDSHYRLLLLADEASRLDEEQQSSKKFKKIPWSQIFHLLGSRYVRDATSRDLTGEDEKGLTILLRCLRNPRIGQLIAPDNPEEYSDVRLEKDVIVEADFDGADPVYILLRNINIPDQTLSIEHQVSLRVESLNQIRHLPRSPQEIAALQRQLTLKSWDDMLNELIPLFAEDIELNAHENEQDRINTLISLVHLKKLPLQTIPLQILAFYPPTVISQPSILYYRLSCTNWVHSCIDSSHIHSIFRALLAAQKRNSQFNLLWNFIASDEEIDAALALSSPQDRSSLSRHIQSERRKFFSMSMLQGFDRLMTEGCEESQKRVMIELLCNDLIEKGPNYSKSSLSSVDLYMLGYLRDPWIRLVAYGAAGIDGRLCPSSISDPDIPEFLKIPFSKYLLAGQPFIDPPVLPRLRMRFWRTLNVYSTWDFMREAVDDTYKLVSSDNERHKLSTHHYRKNLETTLHNLV
jgi:hypothetical protein